MKYTADSLRNEVSQSAPILDKCDRFPLLPLMVSFPVRHLQRAGQVTVRGLTTGQLVIIQY